MIGLARHWALSLSAARQGAAAVEFAIVLPVLAGLIVGLIQYGGAIIAYQQLHNGVSSAAQYVMRGGQNTTAAHDVAIASWPNRPSDGAVTVTQACTCAGAGASCAGLCPDNSYPQSFTTIGASGTYAGPFSNQSMSASQVVRTQ